MQQLCSAVGTNSPHAMLQPHVKLCRCALINMQLCWTRQGLANGCSRTVQTCEHHHLKGHLWELVFDDEGYGVIVSDNPSDAVISLEELLRFSLYDGPQGQLFISGAGEHMMNLADYKAKYTSLQLELRIGCSDTLKSFDAVMYKWARQPAAQVMWCTKSLYKNLGFWPVQRGELAMGGRLLASLAVYIDELWLDRACPS